jgi:hypothetical protein
VAAGESEDFYILVFSYFDEENYTWTGVNGITIAQPNNEYLSTPQTYNGKDFLLSDLNPGKSYWLNVTQTADGLVWSKDVNQGEEEDVTVTFSNKEFSKALYTVLGADKVSFNADSCAVMSQADVNSVKRLDFYQRGLTSLEGLEEFVNKTPTCDVSLFGYPGWVPQISKNVNRLYKLDTYIFSRFYTIPDDAMLYDFSIKYLYWYNEEMKNASPRYAILGFDTGLYFMNAIAKYGPNFANYDVPVGDNTIQTGFEFERISNWSGFINKSFYFVHLSPDMKIEKITP